MDLGRHARAASARLRRGGRRGKARGARHVTRPNSVIEPIERSWNELNGLVDALGPTGLAATGPDGWAVKDHLIHVAAWEHSLIALFEGADRETAMGVEHGLEGTDSINAAVWALHRDKSPEEALGYFRQTHALLVKLLSTLSDADM